MTNKQTDGGKAAVVAGLAGAAIGAAAAVTLTDKKTREKVGSAFGVVYKNAQEKSSELYKQMANHPGPIAAVKGGKSTRKRSTTKAASKKTGIK